VALRPATASNLVWPTVFPKGRTSGEHAEADPMARCRCGGGRDRSRGGGVKAKGIRYRQEQRYGVHHVPQRGAQDALSPASMQCCYLRHGEPDQVRVAGEAPHVLEHGEGICVRVRQAQLGRPLASTQEALPGAQGVLPQPGGKPPAADAHSPCAGAQVYDPLEELPGLKTVQNFVNHYSRTKMENHDRMDELTAWIHERAYSGQEAMTEAFTFAWRMDDIGKPIVGNGSDVRPFLVGISTKALVLRLTVPPESFILHMDGTYKNNQSDSPVLVVGVGVSDRSRRFHLVALFVMSNETQPMFQEALLSLRHVYFWVSGKHLTVDYAMTDGDRAQCNALAAVFGDNPKYRFLMCFFHVMKHIQERVKLLSSGAQAWVLRDLYNLHFARSHTQYLEMLRPILRSWMNEPTLAAFAQYVYAQWRTGHFTAWQVYATPSGFASTNNPVETFNALLKRDYTLRRRLKMGTLLRELGACCQDQSSSARAFEFTVCPAPTLARTVSEWVRLNLLGVAEDQDLDSVRAGACCILRVISMPAPRVSVAPNNRSEEAVAVTAQMGVNYARKEFEGEPVDGWPVDLVSLRLLVWLWCLHPRTLCLASHCSCGQQ
jgi:hypothetical protein